MTDDVELTAIVKATSLACTVSDSNVTGLVSDSSVTATVNSSIIGIGVYVPYIGCLKDIHIGDFNLTTTGYLSGILADGVTAATQSAGDNSTKVATTAYVDTAVSAEDVWDRDGTVLSPHTDGDDVSTTGNITGLNLSGTNTGDITVLDTDEINLSLTGQQISADIKSSSIDETKLDISVNDSLDLADSALQSETDPVYLASQAANIDSGDITNLSNLSGTNSGDQDLAPYELLSNKSVNTSLGTSNTLYPSQNAVKSYVDTAVEGENLWDRDGTVLSPHTDGDDVYVDGAIEATGTGTFGGTSSGQSVIASGLVVNEDGGNTAVDDFRVETISHSDAFKINASTDIAEFNVNVSINADLTATTIDGSLIDGVTAVTQADKDNSTKVATTAYVDKKVDKYEEFEMTSTEISDKYITIIGIINNNQSIRLFLDNIGIKAEQGIDYSVSGNQIFWTGYNLEQSLEAGDKLKIFYI